MAPKDCLYPITFQLWILEGAYHHRSTKIKAFFHFSQFLRVEVQEIYSKLRWWKSGTFCRTKGEQIPFNDNQKCFFKRFSTLSPAHCRLLNFFTVYSLFCEFHLLHFNHVCVVLINRDAGNIKPFSNKPIGPPSESSTTCTLMIAFCVYFFIFYFSILLSSFRRWERIHVYNWRNLCDKRRKG